MGPADEDVAAADWDSVPVSTEAKALLQQHGVKAGTARRLHQDLGFEDVGDVRHLSPALLSQLGLKPLELAPLVALVEQQAQQQDGSAKAEVKGEQQRQQLDSSAKAEVKGAQPAPELVDEIMSVKAGVRSLQRSLGLLEEELQRVKAVARRLDHPLAKRLQEGEFFSGEEDLGDDASVDGVAITPDGRRVLWGDPIGNLRIYDLESFAQVGSTLRAPKAHNVASVAITPDGCRAVSAGCDNELRVWDLATHKCVAVLKGHTNYVTSVAVTPDGSRAVSGSFDQTVRVWSLSDYTCLATLDGHNAEVHCVACTPDGRHAVSAGGLASLFTWSMESYEAVHAIERDDYEDRVRAVAVSPDGRLLVMGDPDTASLVVRELETLNRVATLEYDGFYGEVSAVAITPDGRCALCGTYSDRDEAGDLYLHLWDLQTHTHVAIAGHNAPVISVAITPDGRRAVSSSCDGVVRLLDLQARMSQLQATTAPKS